MDINRVHAMSELDHQEALNCAGENLLAVINLKSCNANLTAHRIGSKDGTCDSPDCTSDHPAIFIVWGKERLEAVDNLLDLMKEVPKK